MALEATSTHVWNITKHSCNQICNMHQAKFNIFFAKIWRKKENLCWHLYENMNNQNDNIKQIVYGVGTLNLSLGLMSMWNWWWIPMIIKSCVVSTIGKESDISNCTIKSHASNSHCRDLNKFLFFLFSLDLCKSLLKMVFFPKKHGQLSNEWTLTNDSI